jgi:Double zinc ribbon
MNSIFQKLSDKLSKSLSKQEYKKSDVPSSSTSTDKEKVYCRFCGRNNPVTSEYCLECGMQTRMLPSNIMKVCQKCGLAVNDDSVYCFSCGTRFDE